MRYLLPCIVLFASALPAHSEEEIYTDPANVPADYLVQGEYRGSVSMDGESEDFGLQVIALGDQKFDATGYHGGLPGDGWDRSPKIHASGRTDANGTTILKADQGTAEIRDGKAVIKSTDGTVLGTLKKIHRKSPTLNAKPPKDAKVLFDGTTAENFIRGRIVMGNLLLADCESKAKFGDHSLHLEFRTPFKPKARGQARGNSGVYLQSRYEVQVLDSFGLEGKDNECGGIYSIAAPAVNACLPPLTWQTYDIDFTAARWDGDKKIRNARVTIRHNGILIHDDIELPHATPGKHPEGPGPGALYLQGHGNPVVYRNIWVVEK